MEGIILILIVLLLIMSAGKPSGGRGGVNVKNKPTTKKPKIYPAPQPMKRK